MLYDLLHSFGAGISFAIGVLCGATMMMWCAGWAKREESAKHLEQQKRCEDRLAGYVINSDRIASVLERMEKKSHESSEVSEAQERRA